MMIKPKKILLIFSFFVFLLSGFYLNLIISKNCKTYKIISSVKDFGLSHIDNCYSNDNLVNSIKKYKEIFRILPLDKDDLLILQDLFHHVLMPRGHRGQK